jgi:hypothetical protein
VSGMSVGASRMRYRSSGRRLTSRSVTNAAANSGPPPTKDTKSTLPALDGAPPVSGTPPGTTAGVTHPSKGQSMMPVPEICGVGGVGADVADGVGAGVREGLADGEGEAVGDGP